MQARAKLGAVKDDCPKSPQTDCYAVSSYAQEINMQRFLLTTAFVLAAGTASAATLTFEGMNAFDTTITSEGYDWSFTASGWGVFTASFIANFSGMVTNGTGALVAAGDRGDSARTTMTQSGGGVFSVQSLSAASSYLYATNTLQLLGVQQGGGMVSTTLTLGTAFADFTLSGFSNLVSLTFASGNSGSFYATGFTLDNVKVNEVPAVPVPAALPLLLAGIGGLVALKRRKA